MDETGANNKGKRHWCWMVGNKEVTVFKLANSRGKKALTSFLPSFEGKVISDGYGVYNAYEKENWQVSLLTCEEILKDLLTAEIKIWP
jgi:hypothetical protein